MKKLTIFLTAFIIVMLSCGWFIPKTNPEGRQQAPAVSCYTEMIEGHKYVIVVATNSNIYNTQGLSPSISVSVVHAESCPCMKEKKEQTITVKRSSSIFD
jgi:hypothetical protein